MTLIFLDSWHLRQVRCDHWTCHERWRSKAWACFKVWFCGKKLPCLFARPSYPPRIFNIGKRQRRVGKGKVLNSLKKPSQKSEDCILLWLDSFATHKFQKLLIFLGFHSMSLLGKWFIRKYNSLRKSSSIKCEIHIVVLWAPNISITTLMFRIRIC